MIGSVRFHNEEVITAKEHAESLTSSEISNFRRMEQ